METQSQDTSLSRSKKRATAGHRQEDGKRALAKQSIIQETFESDGIGAALSLAESRFPRSVSKGGRLKRRARECDGGKERERGRQKTERASKKRAHEIGYFNPSLGKFFVRTSSLPYDLLSPLRPACYPALAFLKGEELIRVPYFSRLQRLPNINRRKRRGTSFCLEREGTYPPVKFNCVARKFTDVFLSPVVETSKKFYYIL